MTINNQVSDADTHGATTGAPVDRHVIPQGLASRMLLTCFACQEKPR